MSTIPEDRDWVAAAAATRPRAQAIIEEGGAVFSYSGLDEMIDARADRLRSEGVAAGEVRVVRVGAPDAALIAELWAIWRLGAVALPIDEQSPLLTTSAELIGQWEEAGAPGTHTILLTSGSAGKPRPVRLTAENVSAAVAASAERLGNTAADRWLLTLPAFHVGGLSLLWRSAAAGGTIVIHHRFDEERVAAAIHAGRVTLASFVPTMLYRLLDFDPGPYRGLKAILLGGAPARRELVERALEAGLPILQTYGMTEACSQVATVVPGQAVESLGSAGPPLAGVSVSTGVAGVGEIMIDGPMVSPGYLGEPDRVGPHATGDIGYLDENGRLVVLGRVDDMVVTGGENVYPGQIADVLSHCELIRDIEIVPVPDPEWGQALVAIAVADAVAKPQIEAWARNWLPRHELPRGWVFVDGLPLLANGKVDRVALSELTRGESWKDDRGSLASG